MEDRGLRNPCPWAVSYPAMKKRPMVLGSACVALVILAGLQHMLAETPVEEVEAELQDDTGMTPDEREELMRTIGYVQQ